MSVFRERTDYASWGRVIRAPHRVAHPRFPDQIEACLREHRDTGPVLPVGLRRSYGDTTTNAGNRLIDMTGLDRLISLDRNMGILRCEAGASFDELLRLLVPLGWFLPTTPGTRFVTIGGAVASDIHGKNHHRAGSLGCSIRHLKLCRSDGAPVVLLPQDPLFSATLGGLGLTGVITEVELSLAPIRSAFLDVERIPFADIGEFFALAAESAAGFEHTVAWIDCANKGKSLGRGIFQRANWCEDGLLVPHKRRGGPAIPFDLPRGLLNGTTVRLFNSLYNSLQQRGPRVRKVHYAPFFYPLDSIRDWNRMYGKSGLYQYQCVIPPVTAKEGIRELVSVIAASGAGSFLAVLKTLGPKQSGGLLSFPMEGATLALDFPNRGAETLALLSRLDRIVEETGGRLYPAKDGRMPAAMFRKGYPDWTRMQVLKDPMISSDFWKRVSA